MQFPRQVILNRARLKARYAYRPVVRYDVFAGAERFGAARIVGKAETFVGWSSSAPLRLPEPAREPVYVPYEESA